MLCDRHYVGLMRPFNPISYTWLYLLVENRSTGKSRIRMEKPTGKSTFAETLFVSVFPGIGHFYYRSYENGTRP